MQKKSWVFFLGLFLVNVILVGCWADQAKETNSSQPVSPEQTKPATEKKYASETEKAKTIQAILADYPLEVWRGTCEECTEERYQFCSTFYEDLKKASPDIQYLEPDLKTDNQNHPELAHYQTACAWPKRKDLPNDESTFWGLYVVGNQDFRLYRKDFNQNSVNGDEELLYAVMHPKDQAGNWKGGYTFIDLSDCIVRTGYPLHVTYKKIDEGQWGRLNNVDALVKYRNNYYVMELYDQKGLIKDGLSRYVLDIYKVEKNLNFKSTCNVRWQPNVVKQNKGE